MERLEAQHISEGNEENQSIQINLNHRPHFALNKVEPSELVDDFLAENTCYQPQNPVEKTKMMMTVQEINNEQPFTSGETNNNAF